MNFFIFKDKLSLKLNEIPTHPKFRQSGDYFNVTNKLFLHPKLSLNSFILKPKKKMVIFTNYHNCYFENTFFTKVCFPRTKHEQTLKRWKQEQGTMMTKSLWTNFIMLIKFFLSKWAEKYHYLTKPEILKIKFYITKIALHYYFIIFRCNNKDEHAIIQVLVQI